MYKKSSFRNPLASFHHVELLWKRDCDSFVRKVMNHCRQIDISLTFPRKNTLRKHAYSNILKILQPKKENFLIKILTFFHIPAQNIDCGYTLEPPRRGGSNAYPQSIFFEQNKKNNEYPCKL